MPERIEITTRSVALIFAAVIGLFLLFALQDVIFLLFICFIVMSALRPIVEYLQKNKVPRGLAILLVYIVLIFFVGLFATFVVPPLVTETSKLLITLPEYGRTLSTWSSIDVQQIIQQVVPIGQSVFGFAAGIFSNVLTLFAIIVITFYFLLEREKFKSFAIKLFGTERGEKLNVIVEKSEERMGAWVRAQLILMLIIGQASFLGLSLLGVHYALPLALIAGLLEAVPIIGPNISAIPAILVALTMNPGVAIAVIVLYFAIQQLENSVLVPVVMKSTVGIPPLASLLALMIGGKLAGVVGVILAVPILLVVQVVFSEIRHR